MTVTKKMDFLGNKYGIGDTVIFSNGRSLAKGTVERMTSSTVTVRPDPGTPYVRTTPQYRDSRTGKHLNRPSRHLKKPNRWINTKTGEEYPAKYRWSMHDVPVSARSHVFWADREFRSYVEYYAAKSICKTVYRLHNIVLYEASKIPPVREYDEEETSW